MLISFYKKLDSIGKACYIYCIRRSTTGVPRQAKQRGDCMNSISSDIIRGYNDTMILYLLLEQPSYGYEISKRIRNMTQEKYIIKETTLYSAFTRMEKNGYIVSFSMNQEGSGKRRTYYRITEPGRQYYKSKCEEWKLTQEVIGHFIRMEEM